MHLRSRMAGAEASPDLKNIRSGEAYLGYQRVTGFDCSERFQALSISSVHHISARRTDVKSLSDIFEHTLQDVYYAENAITKALPKVAKAAKNAQLKKAAEEHLLETKEQIKKLEQVFKSIGKKASGEKCDAIEGLIKEADGLMEEAEGTALDAGLLAACQAVEHYEIARYGSLREWAKDLGHDEAHKLLSEILDQEKATNNKLTNLAVTEVNNSSPGKKAA